MFEARVGVDFRRYFSSMNCYGGLERRRRARAINAVQTIADFTAGGAVDQYLAVSAMLAVTLGGTEIAMPEEAEDAPPPPKRKRKVESEEEEPRARRRRRGGGRADE